MSTITDPNEGTADLRLEFWKIAFQEFLAYPLTGVGGDNYRWQMENFQSLEQTQKFDRVLSSHVHSTYFQLLSELGLAGCITFGFIMFRTYQDYRYIDRLTSQSLSDANKVEDNVLQEDVVWIRNYGRGLIGALLGYMVSVAFLSALYYSHLWIIVSLVIALRAIANKAILRNLVILSRCLVPWLPDRNISVSVGALLLPKIAWPDRQFTTLWLRVKHSYSRTRCVPARLSWAALN
jgi:O-antigen ligase